MSGGRPVALRCAAPARPARRTSVVVRQVARSCRGASLQVICSACSPAVV